MVNRIRQVVDLPIIGMGGARDAEDVIEFMLAGASAVEIGAQNLVDPLACKKIIETLPEAMKKYGIDSLKDIIGAAH